METDVCNLYNEIERSISLDKNILYEKMLLSYPKSKVDFVMYDLFKYIHMKTEEKEIRTDQDKFRNNLIKKYGKCIITGDPVKLCDACHIQPYSNTKNNDIYNGLLLSKTIHAMFDDFDLSIDGDGKVVLSNEVKENENYCKYDGKQLQLDNKTIVYLKSHYDVFIKKHLSN